MSLKKTLRKLTIEELREDLHKAVEIIHLASRTYLSKDEFGPYIEAIKKFTKKYPKE